MSPVSPSNTAAIDAQGSGPVRRCVVCRQTHRKRALLRFVVGPAREVHFDLRQKMPGRGINVCPTAKCLTAAAGGAFKRGARGACVELPGDVPVWLEQIDGALERYYGELISNGFACGQLKTGTNTVERLARDLPTDDGTNASGFAAYLLATDASDGTRKKFESNAGRKGVPVLGLLDRQRLGALTGREEVVVSAWVTGPLFERFAWVESQLEMMRRQRA